ncbi:MAG: InlB B-repeat-containing protein, partial [Propionibacteriaceae bacterium]|nr:InlB B-repeat-containing protein [Propionibacteriaceae bacterium]
MAATGTLVLASLLPGLAPPATAQGEVWAPLWGTDRQWTPASESIDPVSDVRGGFASMDIVGDRKYPSAYLSFGADNSEIAVRTRLDGMGGTTEAPKFPHFLYFGLDLNGDGAVDLFLGLNNPTGRNGRLGIYLADPSLANTAPGNSGLTKPIASFQPRAGENYSLDKVEYDSFLGFGDTDDYYATFRFTLDDINAALTAAGRGDLRLSVTTGFRYVIGTASQDDCLNADINGHDGLTSEAWPFSAVQSIDGTAYFTVGFDSNDGSDALSSSFVVRNGQTILDLPPAPSRPVEAYGRWEFVGWSYEATDTQPLAKPFDVSAPIKADLRVYAIWQWVATPPEQTPTNEMLHFDASGGQWGAGITTKHVLSHNGLVTSLPPEPQPPLFSTGKRVFAGWVTALEDYEGFGYYTYVNAGLNPPIRQPLTFVTPTTPISALETAHEGEPAIYALWIDLPTDATLASFEFWSMIGTSNGDKLFDIYTSREGEPIFTPSPLAGASGDFRGWSTQPGGGGEVYLDPGPSGSGGSNRPLPSRLGETTATSLYAIWESEAKPSLPSVEVTFDATGGGFDGEPADEDAPSRQDCWQSVDGKIETAAYIAPRWLDEDGKTGRVFLGWSYSAQPDRSVDFTHPATEVFTAATTVNAVWSEPIEEYTFTFWPNSGVWPTSEAKPVDHLNLASDDYGLVPYIPYSNAPVYPVREDFDFAGWNTAIDGSGTFVSPNLPISADTHAYAQWLYQDPGYVTVSFAMNDGTGATYLAGGSAVAEGERIHRPQDPQKSAGWHFNGWFNEPSLVTAWDFARDKVGSGTKVLYASWLVDVTYQL